MKRWRNWVGAVCILVLCLEGFILYKGMAATPTPSDTIIILGTRVFGTSPGPMLRPRLEKALELYQSGLAPSFIVSGSQGTDEDASEASVMRDFLVSRGVPAEKIILEDRSFNTQQNLLYSQQLMKSRQWTTAIVVSNVSHIARVETLASKLGLSVTCGAAPMAGSYPSIIRQYAREGVALTLLLIFDIR